MWKILKKYIFNVLIGLDLFFNALFAGDPKMTISTRVYLYRDVNIIASLMYRFLNWLDAKHCEDALKYDQNGTDPENAVLK